MIRRINMETNELRLEAQDLNQQGAMLLKAGNVESARVKFDRAIEIDPMLMDSYKNYGDLYMSIEE
jgi:tetratricopeptide (TPR) repeat protein